MNDDNKKKKIGRPVGYRTKNPANKMLPVKVTEDQLKAYKEASEREKITFSAWVRDKLDKAALQTND